MYSKDVLIGIILAIGKTNLTIYRNQYVKIGYSVKLAFHIRSNISLLKGIQEKLMFEGISSRIKEKESSFRKKPILIVSGINNLSKLIDLIPAHLIEINEDLVKLVNCLTVLDKKHLTLDGLEMIMKMKGVL